MITDKEAIEAWEKIKDIVKYVLYDAPEDLGMSQRQFAKLLNCDRTTYHKYKNKTFSFGKVPLNSIEKYVQTYATTIYQMKQEQRFDVTEEKNID